MEEGPRKGVFLWLGEKKAHSEAELDVSHGVRVLAIEQLINLVNGDDVGHVAHLVIEPGQVDVKLIVVVVSKQLEHALIQSIFLHQSPHHVAVDELVDFLYWHIHPVVGRDVPFELQKVATYVIDIHEREFLVDVVSKNK